MDTYSNPAAPHKRLRRTLAKPRAKGERCLAPAGRAKGVE